MGKVKLNSVNLNYYPSGGGIGFHSDDEFLFDGLNRDCCIISLSLCGPSIQRKFQIRAKKFWKHDEEIYDLMIGHGDLMTMEGLFQLFYLHSVWPGDDLHQESDPFTQGERINLTWRTIVRHLDGSDECKNFKCPLASVATG